MSTTFFRQIALTLATVLSLSAATHAEVTSLQLYYDSVTGNLKLQNTTSGTLAIQSFDIITLGNGTLGAATSNSQGYLSQAAATLPTATFIVSNTSASGYNGVYSQAYASNLGSAILTLQPYAGWSAGTPVGPAGTFFDLGNIAALGMTQADLNARFLTDPEGTPPNFDTPAYGQFLYSFEESPGTFSVTTPGNVVATVPEPSTAGLVAVAAGVVGLAMRRRRQEAFI